MEGKEELAEKYLDMYCKKANADKQLIQRWIPIVAAIRLTKMMSNMNYYKNG